jgi:1,4-dihydroxy-6-naphthoate synthase
MKSLDIGYSPCPNDTFIFYAMIHGKLDTRGVKYNEVLLDVETLNQKTLNAELDMSKVSYHAYGHLREQYCLLRAGGALGRGCGPLVVSKNSYTMEELQDKKIAIPGKLTTAYLLLQLYNSNFSSQQSSKSDQLSSIVVMPFHKIMESIARGEVDAGVIIHESRFTYSSYGLREIMDLGDWWEKETGFPIPLGGIIAKRSLGDDVHKIINRTIRQSISYAFNNRTEPLSYIKEHSQELSDDVINQHINLYVNDYSIDVNNEGERAITELFTRAEGAGIIPASTHPVFSDNLKS